MYWWQALRSIISKSKTSTYRTKDGNVRVLNQSFKGLPFSAQREITDIVNNEQLVQYKNFFRNVDSLQDIKDRSSSIIPAILNSVNGPASLVERVADSIGYRDYGTGYGGRGGMSNLSWMTGVAGQDPAKSNYSTPNLYLSPSEAATIYSQKGLPEVIINKKSRSMLLNGVKIENCKLDLKQLETIKENTIKTGFAKGMSDSVNYSLTYGGAALYPFFKHDSPLSMTMPVSMLAKYGILKKDCVERWNVLDRWNTVHFPNWNPTSADFEKPQYFYIPFLGTDVHSSRIARIVTAPQPGYWGVLMNMGWGVSDIVGWIEAVYNYMNVMQAIPTMINQMSLLARTFNVDGPMAMEGAMVLDQMSDEETIRIREASALNPINLDVIGKLEAIQRDFAQVPELTRLIRQDLAAKAGLLEESLFTVEKKGMGGSENKEAPYTRAEETNRIMYASLEEQLKPVVMIQIINALGLDRDVLKALPYTRITFDDRKLVDVQDRTEVLQATSKGFFDLVAGGLGLADAAKVVEQMSGGLLHFSSEVIEKLEEQQTLNEEREQESHDVEIEAAHAAATRPVGPAGSSSASKGGGGGHSYSDPLKQKSKEKVRSGSASGTNKVGLARAKNKKVG